MIKCGSALLLFFFLVKSLPAQISFNFLPFPDSLSVSSFAVNNQEHIFVTTCCSFSDDGIFRSIDGGQTWECLISSSGVYDFRDIKINPDGKIYAIANMAIGDSSLLKSTDNGENWVKCVIPKESATHNEKLFLTGGDTLYVSQTSNGARLLRSTNDGLDWEICFPNSGKTSESITDLAVDDNGDIYISLFGYIGTAGGVYKSEDLGLSWELLGLLSSQVTDIEFNSLGDLLISVRSSIGPLGGICTIYHGTEDIIEIFGSAFTSGLVINSGDDIFAGDNFQNGIYHSNDGQTFNFLNTVMPGDCPISNLYLDSNEFLYAFMFGTPYISKSTLSTTTSSKQHVIDNQLRICLDRSQSILYVTLKEKPYKNVEFRITDCGGATVLRGNIPIHSSSIEIPLPHLTSGVYILQVFDSMNLASEKFLISR